MIRRAFVHVSTGFDTNSWRGMVEVRRFDRKAQIGTDSGSADRDRGFTIQAPHAWPSMESEFEVTTIFYSTSLETVPRLLGEYRRVTEGFGLCRTPTSEPVKKSSLPAYSI